MTTLITSAEGVADELARRLATIRTPEAETDIGRKIFRGRRRIPADDETPCLFLVEVADAVEDRPGKIPQVYVRQTYYVDAFDDCNPDDPNVKAHAMIRDIKRAIFGDETVTLGGRVTKVEYLGRDIGPRADGVAKVQVRVMLDVSYVESLAHP